MSNINTPRQIIRRALAKLGVLASESPITDQEMTDALDQLHDMMLQWDSQGINLGYQIPSGFDETSGLPDWSLGAVKSNLAIRLAPEFGRPIDAGLANESTLTFTALLSRAIQLGPVEYPNILPIGDTQSVPNEQKYYRNTARDDLLGDRDAVSTDNLDVMEVNL